MKTSVKTQKTILLELSEEEAQHLLNVFNWGCALSNVVQNHLPESKFSGLAWEKDIVAKGFDTLTDPIVRELVDKAGLRPYRRIA